MLKAHIIKESGYQAVHYPDGGRTLSLSDCLKKVFTNESDPLRTNLEIVIELRNTSTHFVTEEYELFYGPILQECVKRYEEKLRDLHHIEISDRVPENYLALSVRRGDIDYDAITARYPREVVEKMLSMGSSVLASRPGSTGIGFATELRLTKKKGEGIPVRVEKGAEAGVAILKSLTNPLDKYTYRTKTATLFIGRKLENEGIEILVKGVPKRFNAFHFDVFVKFYEMKSSETFSYNTSPKGESPSWLYSQQAVDLILQELRRNPEGVIDGMRAELARRSRQKSSNKEKPTPGAREF